MVTWSESQVREHERKHGSARQVTASAVADYNAALPVRRVKASALVTGKSIRQGGSKLKGTRYSQGIVSAFFKSYNLPAVEFEFVFAPPRKFRFDFAWRYHRVALEVEGGVWSGGAHGRGSGIVRDIEKYNLAASMGWFVLRCTPQDLCLVETAALVERTIKKSREKN